MENQQNRYGMVFTILWVAFFFQGMSAGCWIPPLTNILHARGLGGWVTLAFVVPPLCALVAPLIGGALADQRVAADRLLAWSTMISAVLIWATFAVLDAGWHPVWFLILLGLHSLVSGPTWGLLAMVSMSHLSDRERHFPLVRVGATIGWVVGGLMISFILEADKSPAAGYAAAVTRLIAGAVAFAAPRTLPQGGSSVWWKRLGLGAFSLLKHRDHAVFFLVTALYSIPLAAFYMNAAEFFHTLGNQHPTGLMTVAQMVEMVSMFAVGTVMVRYRVRGVLLWALGISILRMGLSSMSEVTGWIGWHVGGVALHGMTYVFYFITAQVFLDRRVEPDMRGQAQGLLAMVSGGLGPLLGAVVCGELHDYCLKAGNGGWTLFWGILAGMIAVCFGIFAMFYKGLKKKPDEISPNCPPDTAR